VFKRRRIALLIESSRAYGRGLLRGIASYVKLHGPWSLVHQERGLGDDVPDWLSGDAFDGVIARIDTRALLDQIVPLALPTVDLRGTYTVDGIPVIDTDERAVASAAAQHLLERRFANYAYCGIPGAIYSRRRLEHFEPLIESAGFCLHVYSAGATETEAETADVEAREMLTEARLGDWLDALPKPVGLFVCNDIRGRQVLNACRARGITVPFEVAVLGVDDDEVLCGLADPPLSSVLPNTRQVGYLAGATLHRLMNGERDLPPRTLVSPVAVVTRASTDVLAVDDLDVAAAMSFIRENACRGIKVEDVLRKLAVSRSTLERRFARSLGRSPKEEITRVRVERLKQLLLETDNPLDQVARAAGFAHTEHMCVLFKATVGTTPGAFRSRARARLQGVIALDR
jgi:LacI family transcriptional regulator